MPKKKRVKTGGHHTLLLSLVAMTVIIGVGAGGYLLFINGQPSSRTSEIQTFDFPNRLGSEDAPITIIEFGEYQCPNCALFFRNVFEEFSARYIDTGLVKMYYRDFPYYGPESFSAAIAARCAGEQGQYWEYHHTLYEFQGEINSGWANNSMLKVFAVMTQLEKEGVGDVAAKQQFDTCLDSERYLEEIRADYEDGLRLGVSGTPTFIIIGPDGREERIVGAQPLSVFERVIESMLGG